MNVFMSDAKYCRGVKGAGNTLTNLRTSFTFHWVKHIEILVRFIYMVLRGKCGREKGENRAGLL